MDLAKGERLLKDIYEALRAGKVRRQRERDRERETERERERDRERETERERESETDIAAEATEPVHAAAEPDTYPPHPPAHTHTLVTHLSHTCRCISQGWSKTLFMVPYDDYGGVQL